MNSNIKNEKSDLLKTTAKRKEKMMLEKSIWEDIQTEYSYMNNVYKLCQEMIDTLDEKCERIRRFLESEV